MRKPKKNLVAPGSTLTWGRLEDMYGPAIAQAVQDLEPVTTQEAITLVTTFQILSAARRPMLPTERSECERLRRQPILAAAAVRCAELHRTEQTKPQHLLLRDAVTMVQELCIESGDAEPIGRLDDWVWGPTGPPCEDGSAPSGETPLQRWERHASIIGTEWNDGLHEAFVAATDVRVKQILDASAASLEAMEDAVDNVLAAINTIRVARQSVLEGEGSLLMDVGAADEDSGAASQKAWDACALLRAAATQAMDAARHVYVQVVSDIDDIEDRAMQIVRRVGWTQAVTNQWDDHSPWPTEGDEARSYWSYTSPSPDEFWTAAFMVARCQVGFAADGNHGTARMLMNRA